MDLNFLYQSLSIVDLNANDFKDELNTYLIRIQNMNYKGKRLKRYGFC